jgi:hypothetical protein
MPSKSSRARSIGGVVAGEVNNNRFAMVHIKARGLNLWRLPPNKRKPFISVAASNQQTSLSVMGHITKSKQCQQKSKRRGQL